MNQDIQNFLGRMCNLTINEEPIIEERLKSFKDTKEAHIIALINHELFAGKFKLTEYLRLALERGGRQHEGIRKKVYQFLSEYIQAHHSLIIEHIKSLFSQLLTLFWREEGKLKELALSPLLTIIQTYDSDFLLNSDVINPSKLHGDVTRMLQTQKKTPGVIGECFYLLSVLQSIFTTHISPSQKKNIQENSLVQLKNYVQHDSNLSTITALLRGLAKSLRENYIDDQNLNQLFRHIVGLILPLKATYNVPIAALQLLQQRRQLFHSQIMQYGFKLFDSVLVGVSHRNKQYSLKCMEVLVLLIEQFIKGITINKQKYKKLFDHIINIIITDLRAHIGKEKGELQQNQRKSLNLLSIIRILGIMSPLYLQFKGKQEYQQLFSYIIRKCTKKIMRENNNHQPITQISKGQEIKYILYYQKELISFIDALARLIEQLEEIQYDEANQLEVIMIEAIKQSRYFLNKYENSLWEAMAHLIMSVHEKKTIFSRWSKKVVSESLRECLDSAKMKVVDDEDYIKMIQKSSSLWTSLLGHAAWRGAALSQFAIHLLSNIEYLIMNLDCSYKDKTSQNDDEFSFQKKQQLDGLQKIFYLTDDKMQITKVEDYQFLNSLSLLFNQILMKVDPTLYEDRVINFYPQVLERVKLYPKCLPLLRTIRSLNQFLLKNNWFGNNIENKKDFCQQILCKMRNFFNQTCEIVFKFQQLHYYQLLKVMLSFSDEVYLMDQNKIIRVYLPQLLIKTLELGQQIISLADIALRCIRRIFTSQTAVAERYLLEVIPALQKFINIQSTGQKDQFKSQLFLSQQNINRKSISEGVLQFLGSLGGCCHFLVDNRTKDHISWDYDCHLQIQIIIQKDKYNLNMARVLHRICWLAINGKQDIKIVACELLHAKVTYVIAQAVSNKTTKANIANFLDRTLPTILSIAGNSSHPSQQLLHTLLMQTIHFFANTKQPNTPDIQTILKHLLSLYNKSQNMGQLASRCLSQFIRWHIKQQTNKNGDVPILKALIGNIWSLVSNKQAREGLILFLTKLLRIIHTQSQIMRYYLLQFGSLLISLTRYQHPLQKKFKYLIQKYVKCLNHYMKYLIIDQASRRYKKIPNIQAFLDYLYKIGFFSLYNQQREASFMIWHSVLTNQKNIITIGINLSNFLKQRSKKQKKYLFGSSIPIIFQQSQQIVQQKLVRRVVAQAEVWVKILEHKIIQDNSLIQFADLQKVYIASFINFLTFLREQLPKQHFSCSQQLQKGILSNFNSFLKLLYTFQRQCSIEILQIFNNCLSYNNIQQSKFNHYLFAIIFNPQQLLINSMDSFKSKQIEQYMTYFVHYLTLRSQIQRQRINPLEKVFVMLQSDFKMNVYRLQDYICCEQSASERKIKAITNLIKVSYIYQDKMDKQSEQPSFQNSKLNLLLAGMLDRLSSDRVKPQREFMVISFITSFQYQMIIKFISHQIKNNGIIYQKYQRIIFQFIVEHWSSFKKQIITNALTSIDRIKFLFVLLKRLKLQQKQGLMIELPKQKSTKYILRDLLKINFILVQQFQQMPIEYLKYLDKILQDGFDIDNSLDVHEQTLYLCGLLCKKQVKITSTMAKLLKPIINTFGNKYCPFMISKLKTGDQQQNAMRYFSIIRNFIIISEQFQYIQQFFSTLKDGELGDRRNDIISGYIQDCTSTCFSLYDDRPIQWAQYLMNYFWNQELDKDQLKNFRLLIIDKIFRRAIAYIKLESLYILFNRHIDKLQGIIVKKISKDSVKNALLDLQIKKSALLIIELFYGNLPRRQKKDGKTQNQMHKIFIKECVQIVKSPIDQKLERLFKDYDAIDVSKIGKAMSIYREYCCFAYNCLIMLFISTQSNKQHFKTFLFQKKGQSFWINLVNPQQIDFGFQILTDFKVMQPYSPMRTKVSQVKAKIQKQYFQSSLYIVEEQNIPLSQLPQIKEENEEQEEKQAAPVVTAASNFLIDTEIQEDIINKHFCMLNLLRVVDFMHKMFLDPQPTWMKPIDNYLSDSNCSLAERIFLIKLILNRPTIFFQADIWAKHLLYYLSLKQNGGKFIHYFFRDALKRFITFLPLMIQERPVPAHVNLVVMKLVRSLPFQNLSVYFDNVQILQKLMNLPNVYIQKNVINKMLKSDEKDQKKCEWRLCAIIVLKLALNYQVPILTDEQYLKNNQGPKKYQYYFTGIKLQLRYIYQMMEQSSKKYRIAAAGCLGQYLLFIWKSNIRQEEKKEHFKGVAQFLTSLLQKKANRTTKERFTLALQKISARFPHILQDQKVFGCLEDGLAQFSGSQREQLMIAFRQYCINLLKYNQTGRITNFFMNLRTNCEKMVIDIPQVQHELLLLLNLCTDSRLLRSKDIMFTYSLIIDKLQILSYKEQLSTLYFTMLIKIKKYLVDPESSKFQFGKVFLERIQQKLLVGLNSKFTDSYKLIFQELQNQMRQLQKGVGISKFLQINRRLFKTKLQQLWLVSVVPLLFTLCKSSSDYTRMFSQTKLQENMIYYDWNFRHFKINDASLPYTPFTIFADKRKDLNSQKSSNLSQTSNLRGMIRQTQQNYSLSQEQIFTNNILSGSQHNEFSQSSFQPSQQISQQYQEGQGEQRFSKINELFRNKRKRNQNMEDFKITNISKTSPAVKYIQDKIRFTKKIKNQISINDGRIAPKFGQKKQKNGVILRQYKLGELPDIQISLKDIIQPLIFLCSKDCQIASELFLQLMDKMCYERIQYCQNIRDLLCHLITSSQKYQFNFISTLEKGLIRICQKHDMTVQLSLKEIALKSNTLDYGVLFTQQNLIQGLRNPHKLQGNVMDQYQLIEKRMFQQRCDLADFYQQLNEHDFIQSVMMQITQGDNRKKMSKALKDKREGNLNQSKRLISDIMNDSIDQRFRTFLQKEKIDCAVLLSQWDDLCSDMATKMRDDIQQSGDQLRMLTIALQNIEPEKRISFLEIINFKQQKYEYQQGIIEIMKEGGLNKANYYALKSKELFRREWHRISSFAFNSKHDILQSLQKNHQMIQFLDLYRKTQVKQKDCKDLFQKWSNRVPDQIFDDNINWIQILSSRILFGKMLAQRWSLSVQMMARSNTEWLVQVVNGMLGKRMLGYAQNIIRRALPMHAKSQQFNWGFYDAVSQLKLLQLIKKGSLKLQDYENVPKLIQKQMNKYNNCTQLSNLRLILIRNQYLQGYLQVSMSKQKEMNSAQFVNQISIIFKNYQQLKRGIKNNLQITTDVRRNIHFRFSMFLQTMLSMIRGQFQITQVKQSLQKQSINVKLIATNFIEQLIYTIKVLNFSGSSGLNYEEDQQLFSMILKLIKIVQVQYKVIGKYFQDAITDRHIPKWIFIYFIPQIIKNINNYDISIHFKELFEYFLINHPQSLVYPFNCTFPRKKDCLTDLSKKLYDELHNKMNRYFQFINNLFLLQHPELRLKDIFQKYLQHGQLQIVFLQLQDFIAHNPYIGKYNKRFNQNWKNKIDTVFQLKKKGNMSELQNLIRNYIVSLDPAKSNLMKFFVKVSDGSTWFEQYNSCDWLRLEVPGTSYNKFEEPQSWKKVYIDSFDYNLLTLTSIRRPKRLTLLGSNQKVYMLLVKGGQDVRLDQRVQQLFGLINRIMSHHPQTNKRQLQINRFQVIPMKPMFGVFEWVDKSKTLRNFLQAQLQQIRKRPQANLTSGNEAFTQFMQYINKICPGSNDKNVWHKTLMAQPKADVQRNFTKCQSKIPYGLLRFALQKLTKNFDSFLHVKNQLLSNYSAVCLVTYIFGIGDRHLDNFLVQTSTGNLVMIDFGYSFCASIDLAIPQLIPFRMTKIFKDLAFPIGVDGPFKKCMLACFEALSKKMELIVDYCDVFVDDPLMEWVWNSRKQLKNKVGKEQQPSVSLGQSFTVSQQAPQRALFSSKIKVVQNKLRGGNPRKILQKLLDESRHKQSNYIEPIRTAIWQKSRAKGDTLSAQQLISELLSMSTDKNILGRSYIGLNLFV